MSEIPEKQALTQDVKQEQRAVVERGLDLIRGHLLSAQHRLVLATGLSVKPLCFLKPPTIKWGAGSYSLDELKSPFLTSGFIDLLNKLGF